MTRLPKLRTLTALAALVAFALGTLVPSDSFANAAHTSPRVVSTLTGVGSGGSPFDIEVNTVTNRIYVLKQSFPSFGAVVAIDGATDAVLGQSSSFGRTLGMAVDEANNRVLATDLGGHVRVLDGTTLSLITTVTVGSGPRGVSVDETLGLVYVTEGSTPSGPGFISIWDSTTYGLLARLPVASDPFGVVADSARGRAYVTHGSSSDLTVIDGASLSVAGTVPIGPNGREITVDEVTGLVYAQRQGVTIVDGPAEAVVGQIPGNFMRVAVDNSRNRLYTVEDRVFTSYDLGTLAPLGSAYLGGSTTAFNVNPVTDRAYVGGTSSTVYVVADRSNAGPTADGTVTGSGFSTVLNASASSDPDGDTLRYTWRQLSGPPVFTEIVRFSPFAFIFSPAVPLTTVIDIELTVDDGIASDTTTIQWVLEGPEADPLNWSVLSTGLDSTEVGVSSTVNGGLVGGAGDTTMSPQSAVGDVISGGNVNVGVNATTGDVTAGGTVDVSAGATTGTVTEGATISTPQLPTDSVSPGSQDIVRSGKDAKDGPLDLAPGQYGVLDSANNDRLVLHGGTYDFSSVSIGTNTTLTVDVTNGQPLYVRVAGDLDFGINVEMEVIGGDASDILFIVGGNIDLGLNGEFQGTFSAADGTAELGIGAQLDGAIWGSHVELGPTSVVNHVPYGHTLPGGSGGGGGGSGGGV